MNLLRHSLLVSAMLLSAALPAVAFMGPARVGSYDVRVEDSTESRAALEAFRAAKPPQAAGLAATRAGLSNGRAVLAARAPGLKIEVNPRTKLPEIVEIDVSSGASGALSAPSGGGREAATRAFVSGNAGLFGLSAAQAAQLQTVSEYANPAGNLSWVELQQTINGIPVFQGSFRAAIRKDGAIARTMSNLAAGLDYAALPGNPTLTPAEAIVAAARSIGETIDVTALPASSASNAGRTHTFAAGVFDGPIKTELVYFALEPGLATLAYSMVLWEPVDAYYILVDAQTGQLLWRKNITNDQTQAATYSVYDGDSPVPLSPSNATPGSGIQGTPLARTAITVVSEGAAFNNLGWIPDGGNTTSGNNVDAGVDLDATDGVDVTGRATGSPTRVFNFAYIPGGQPGGQAPTGVDFRRGAVTNLFFWSNRYHDRLYELGFTEAARNFQQSNFGRGGLGNDRVSAEAQDSSGTNNANFSTPPDGQPGRMQMFVFTGPTPDRDGDLDQEIVIHELTHGTSNRLHGNGSGLTSIQSVGMGEGWSDFYGRALLATADEDVGGVYASGAYSTHSFFGLGTDNYYYGIRRFPYALKSTVGANGKPHNPLTFADIDPSQNVMTDGAFPKSPIIGDSALEVHNIGEVWCAALLEVRARIINRLGFAAGNQRALQIVTDGMKLDPINPTLLQARNAILAADAAGFAGEDIADIWAGFAAVGMGFNASITGVARVVESFITPNLVLGAVTFSDAVTGNNNGSADPGETILLDVPVTNLLTTTATGATATVTGGGAAAYGDIPNGSTVNRPINYTVPLATPSGTRLTIPVAINSSFGPVGPGAERFFITVGTPTTGFTENFDALPGGALPAGWTTSVIGAGVNWSASTTNSDTPTRNAFTPNVGSSGTATMTTPNIAITSPSAELTFRTAYNFERATVFGSFEVFFDGMLLEMSVNNAAFQDILIAGGSYLTGGPNASVDVFGGRSGWSGLSGGTSATPGYVTVTVLLPASANGKNVRFRWQVACDQDTVAPGAGGARIDSVIVKTGTTSTPVTGNQPPVINDQSLSVPENSPDGTSVGTVVAVDPNPGQTLTYAIIAGNTNNAFAIASTTGEITVNNAAVLDFETTPVVSLTVQVTDSDSNPLSDSAIVTINIQDVNDAPTLDPISNPAVIDEDTGPQTVNLSGIGAGAGENQALTVLASSGNPALIANLTVNYASPASTGSVSYTTVPNASGDATITVSVDDGQTQNNTVSRSFNVVVNAVNDPPIADGQIVSTPVGVDMAITLSGSDAENSPLTFSIVTPPAHGTLSGNGADRIYNPDDRYHGPDSFTFVANDGQFDSAPATVNITVGVGDPPVAHAQSVNTLEDAAVPVTLTGTDPENTPLTFTIVTPPAQGSLSGTGANRTYTPNADSNGTDSFTFMVNDGQFDSNVATVDLAIAAVNDAPTFVKGPDQAPPANGGPRTVPGWASDIKAGPPDESGQTLSFATSTDNGALFASPPAVSTNGTLTYELVTDAIGSATVTVTLSDSGGAANGGVERTSQTFVIRGSTPGINDPPTFEIKATDAASARGGRQTVKKFATRISPGPSDERAQKVDFIVEVPPAQQTLFKVLPAISRSGTLTYTPASKTNGTATVTARLKDDGGGNDTSPPETFTISVLAFAEEAGLYNGLAQAAVGGTPGVEKTGLFKLNLSRTGSFTAKLKLGGRGTFGLRGVFDEAGVAHFGKTGANSTTLKRKNLTDLALALQLDVNGASDKVTGTVTQAGDAFATVEGDRALYTAKKNPTAPRQNVPSALLGKYTVLFAGKTPADQGLLSNKFPQGDGYGVLKVSKSGTARIVGALADGSKVSYGNKLSKANVWPLWASLSRGKGAITGPVSFRETAGISDVDGLNLLWFKRSSTKAKRYPDGWPQGIKVDFVGSTYDVPPKNPRTSVLPGLGGVDSDGNAELTFSEGNLPNGPIVRWLNIHLNNDIKSALYPDKSFHLKIKARSGIVRGGFIHALSGKEVGARGVVFQKQKVVSGFFLGPTESGAMTIVPDNYPGVP